MSNENTINETRALVKATSVYGRDYGIWVYVGTYHKYTCGSLAGKWLCLEDFSDKEEFYTACKELHKDEHDPEFMFQDYEGPKCFYSESHLDDLVWEYLALDPHDQEIVKAYIENRDLRDFQEIIDAYHGTFPTAAEYVQDCWEQCSDYTRPKNDTTWWHPSNYTDWDRMADDLEHTGDVHFIDSDNGVMVFSAF